MVTNANGPLDEAKRQADTRSNALMLEFHAHIEEFTALHPEHAGQDRMMFEAWAIQKIAGLQLSVEHLAGRLNRHLNDNKGA